MVEAYLIYPHQLYEALLFQAPTKLIFLIEEPLLFTQFSFHKKKLIFHRATMKSFAHRLEEKGFKVIYVESGDLETTADIVDPIKKAHVKHIHLYDLTDEWLEKRLLKSLKAEKISITHHQSPGFYLSNQDVEQEFVGQEKFMMASFYINQRKRFQILTENGKPVGGKWSYDTENRKKIPKNFKLPLPPKRNLNPFVREATDYVQLRFGDCYGSPDEFFYPVTHEEARSRLSTFLEDHLAFYGDFQDAIVMKDSFLFHSLLSPLLNVGLLTPDEVVNKAISYASGHQIPLNCLEGFIRQMIGWREFVRGVYQAVGNIERTKNFWGHIRPLPHSFWEGNTGIEPVDNVIKKVLKTGYANHIERLMVMSNFMLLCEIRPDDIYRWFMELFIDAFDWVMVPNVYGMGSYADGGMITTKPYISGSNYILKMSDCPKGEWAETWNSLYWNFIHKNQEVFVKNPRSQMMALLLKKMDPSLLQQHQKRAELFLASLK